MPIDNALDAEDLSSQQRFNDLSVEASSISSSTTMALAYHKIIGLRLIPISVPHYHVKDLKGIQIDSRLTSADLTPGHTTAIVNLKGQPVRDLTYNDNDRGGVEHAIYILNRNEVRNINNAGAYDNPVGFIQELNNQLVGNDYHRPTQLSLQTLHFVSNPDKGVMGLNRPWSAKKSSITMINSEDANPYFAESVTDNSFSFLFADAVHAIALNYKANDNGFRIDQAVVGYHQRQAQNMYRDLYNEPNTSDVETSQDLIAESQHQGADDEADKQSNMFGGSKTLNDVVNPITHKKTNQTDNSDLKADMSHDHVSLQPHRVTHELNTNQKFKESKDTRGARNISKKPHKIIHELETDESDNKGNSRSTLVNQSDKNNQDIPSGDNNPFKNASDSQKSDNKTDDKSDTNGKDDSPSKDEDSEDAEF